jgi:hypothetical protein
MHDPKRFLNGQLSHFLEITIEAQAFTVIQDYPNPTAILKHLNQPTDMLGFEQPENINFIFYEINIIGAFKLAVNLCNFNRP